LFERTSIGMALGPNLSLVTALRCVGVQIVPALTLPPKNVLRS